MGKRKCVFCARNFSSSSKRAKEHIYPSWLLSELDIKGTSIYTTHFRPFDKAQRAFFKPKRGDLRIKQISQRKHVFAGLVYGLVCEKCNNGFLNDIEKEAKPILLKMIKDRRVVLREEEQKVISKWGFKTAIILNISSNFEGYFSEETFHNFYITKQPEKNMLISIAKLSKDAKKGDYWIQARNFIFEFPELSDFYINTITDKFTGISKGLEIVPKQAKIAQDMGNNSFSIVLNIGGILIKVFYIFVGGYPVNLYEHKPGESKIWPLDNSVDINWPLEDCFKNLIDFQTNIRVRVLSN